MKPIPKSWHEYLTTSRKIWHRYSYPNTEIVISTEKLEHETISCFQNCGEDIPNEALAALFDKFYWVDQSRSSDTGGTELGLAITKESTTLHGWEISASSKNHNEPSIIGTSAKVTSLISCII